MPSTRHSKIVVLLSLIGTVRWHELAFGEGEITFFANRNYEVLHYGGVRQAEPAFIGPNLASSSLVVTVLVAGTSILYGGAVLDVVQFTSTCTANVTFAWLAAPSISNGMSGWAIA